MIAHIRKNGDQQSVNEHLESTALIAAEAGRKIGLYYTMFLVGLLHDLGKNIRRFKEYIKKAFEDPKSVRRGEINHSSAGGKYIHGKYYKNNSIQKLTAQLIAGAIVSHHGLTDFIDIEGENKYDKRVKPSEEIDYEKALENSREIFDKYDIDKYFELSLKEIDEIVKSIKNYSASKDAMQFYLGCLERVMLSMLIDADRTDTSSFMNQIYYDKLAGEEIQKLWSALQGKLNDKLETFRNNDSISLLRKDMSKECLEFAANPPGIYSLPIPTGGGKTYCGMRFALKHAITYGKERIIYMAPFLSILEQNAEDIKNIFKADEYILEHHSNIIQDDEEDYNRQIFMETWTSPVILTTFVQFLNTLFSKPNQNRMKKISIYH